nr:YchJ family metal-binding protein [Chitinivorax tropicus]
MPCPCGSRLAYQQCCEPLHLGRPAASPEALMRSRFTAFALNRPDYLLFSWHASTRPANLDLHEDPPIKWIGLEIKHSHQHGYTGEVEFIARYKIGGRAGKLHERSRFEQVDGFWQYLDGDQLA